MAKKRKSKPKGKRLKILWMSEQPTRPTGYAVVTRAICKRLVKRGHEVYVMGWDYNGEDFKHPEGWTMVHAGIGEFGGEKINQDGETVIGATIDRLKPDVVISLIDPWFIGKNVIATNLRGTPYVAYMPVDGYPLSYKWKDIFKLLHTPLWMANYGREQFESYINWLGSEGTAPQSLRDPMLDRYNENYGDVLYHGVELKTFKPISVADKLLMRQQMNIPWEFVFLSVGKNTNRKQQPRLLESFRLMLDRHPDPSSVGLIIHCGDPTDSYGMGGWDLPVLVEQLGLRDNVMFSDSSANPLHGLSTEQMAALYQLSDVHILATGGEGFGIPTAEAMACGLPCILPDNSTGPELIGDNERGFLVPCSTFITGPKWGVNMGLVDVVKQAQAMLDISLDTELRQTMSKNARDFALENFDWNDITTQVEGILRDAAKSPHPLGNNSRVGL